MSTLVQAALTLRKTARASYGFLVAVVLAALVWLGVFRVHPTQLGLEHALVMAVWAAVLSSRLIARRRDEDDRAGVLSDLELGLLLLAPAYAAVELFGGLTGALYPLVYAIVAFLSAFSRKPAGALLVIACVMFEAGLWFVTESHTDVRPFAMHALFIVSFGLLNLVFTRAEIARVRLQSKQELDGEKERVKEDARLFRLVAAPTDGGGTQSGVQDEQKLFRSSLEQVHQALYFTLDLLKRTLDLQTCVLFMKNETDDELVIAELVTDSDDVAEGPFAVGEGAVGAVAQGGMVMNLEHLKPGYKGLCYYRGPAVARAFLGVPVVEPGGQIRGALCADRLDDRPFSPRDEAILKGAVQHVLRAIENERVFVQLERSKREQSILYRASQTLGAALTEDAVMDAGLSGAADVSRYDYAAITLYDATQKKHTIRRAVGEGAAELTNLTFRDNTSLTAMAVRNRHYLPYRGEFDASQQVVYTKKANLADMQSLLVLPLLVRDDAIGTLCLAARRRDAFGPAVRPTLQVLGNQLAIALANAGSVRRLEELATTDGLTGCLNKRAFMDEMDKRIKSAERFGRKLSLLVTDIDHFKRVNDTYGHATGDVVIRALGEVLRRVKRETDVVARFGGEEFCVLCEETDTEGAVHLAERVREELSAMPFRSEIGQFNVTCSLGVATFPRDGKTQGTLFEAADKALYAAKHAGRNKVCVVGDT